MTALRGDGRGRTFAALFAGYAGYYVCRATLPAATPLILEEFASEGVDKEFVGWVASAGTVAYMLGKIVNGALADRLGGRGVFVAGMLGSAACAALFGAVGFGLFALVWSASQFCQSAGWGALVQVVARRFEPVAHATVMGLLSMSFLLGNAAALFYLGGLRVGFGLGWRELFFAAAATLLVIALATAVSLGREPRGVPTSASEPASPSERGVVGRLARTPAFWAVCALSGGMTLLRTAFNTWSTTFLSEAVGMEIGGAIWGGALFAVVGASSAALAGFASDRWRGRRGPVIAVALAGLTAVLVVLATAPLAGNAPLALTLVAAAGFLLTGPYSFCAGVLALDLGGRRGAATAAGLIDAAGYLCAVASGVGVGAIAQRSGWPAVFLTLAGVSAATAAAGFAYATLIERPARGGGS